MASLSARDQMGGPSFTQAGQVKLRQVHTTWFFEVFVLRLSLPKYRLFREVQQSIQRLLHFALGEDLRVRRDYSEVMM